MKHISSFLVNIVILWLGFCTLADAQAPTPVAANGRLKLVGRQLSNEAGKAIQLRGMSSHGLHWFGQCYNAGAIQTLASQWGADVFRAAMYVDEGGYTNNPAGLRATVDNIVDWTAQNGIYCIIDWHILNPGDPNIHLNEAKQFFQIMAQKHAGKKHVIYEICNEPNGVSWSSVKSYAEQVIPIIRQYDSEAIILVGTPNWSGTPGDVISNPLTGTNAYNVMYTFHFYAGSHYSQSYIDNVLKSVPLFVSEWGTSNYSGNGGNDYTNGQNWINLMAGQNSSGIKVSWCNWSFCDKDESSAALVPGACGSNGWNNTSQSGAYVKNWILSPADDFGPATPAVTIASPAANTTVTIGANVVIAATVSNTTAASVAFYSGNTKLGDDTTAPYAWTITGIAAGSYTLTAQATLPDGQTLTSTSVQVTAVPAPNQIPTVSLTAPAANAGFTAPALINLSATATDADGSVVKVEFYNGNTKLGEITAAPYTFSWTNVAAGYYTVSAKAIDNQGAIGTSATVNIIVTNPGSSGADLIGPDCVSVNDIKIFELNPNLLQNATNFSWWSTGSTSSITPTQPGKATFNFGPYFSGGQVCVGVNYSAAPWYQQFCKTVSVCSTTVTPPANQPPTVALTSPANSATFTAPASVTISANASDSDGTIAKVEFYNGTAKLGESMAMPYRFVWGNVAAGTYTLSAKAMDNAGAVTTSGTVTINVLTATVTPPTPATAGIVGPDCVAANAVTAFELNPAYLANATNFSWWCTGSTSSVTPTQPGKVSIHFGPWFTGGDLCVGVNYSASPWYRQFCKRVNKCSAGAREAIVEEVLNVAYPNPTADRFTFVADQDIYALRVLDMLGVERSVPGSVQKGEKVIFGDNLNAGHYLLDIQYTAGGRRTIKLVKAGR
ncbi:cellulase family glycosylhydrolase [Arsenicibacter rosenii]|uniref:PKD/Chitinase domain-containing protein n=1 Tax=Arsenicibacter rosenii TaxID=1750698 RepID=A0A1S2VPA6_9BACT|nr:cellulase family glycosylhydrolase [Arsenicibacter rosenii]OIN60026.1 hypothetical protein BLX24_04005 [Arsenicibacter rosenii]